MTTLRFSLSKFSLSKFSLTLLAFCLLLLGAIGGAWAQTTLNADFADVRIVKSGDWRPGYVFSPAFAAGTATLPPDCPSANNGYIESHADFAFTGTTVAAHLQVQSVTQVYVSVDGGVYTAVSLPAVNTPAVVSLVSGLTDALHRITITSNSASGLLFVFPTDSIQITGAAPALSAPAGFGSVYRFLDSAAQPSFNLETGLSYTAYINNGYDMMGAANGVNSNAWAGSSFSFQVSAASTSVKMYCADDGASYLVLVDGVLQSVSPTASVDHYSVAGRPGYDYLTLAALDGLVAHTITVVSAVNGYGGGLRLSGIMVVGGTLINPFPAGSVRPRMAFFGDSITQGATGTANSFAFQVATRLGYADANRGIGGSAVHGGQTPGEGRTQDVITASPSVCFINYLHNDEGYTNATTFQTAYANMLTLLVAGLPSCQFYCTKSYDTGATATSYNAAVQSAVASVNNNRVHYVDDTTGFILASMSNDGVHPNMVGYNLLSKNIATILTPTGTKRKTQ